MLSILFKLRFFHEKAMLNVLTPENHMLSPMSTNRSIKKQKSPCDPICICTNHHNHAKSEFDEIKMKLSVSPLQHSYDSQMKITRSKTDING